MTDEIKQAKTLYQSWQERPHEYVPTDPYRGCATCGYGPGAYFHNSFTVVSNPNRELIALISLRHSIPIEMRGMRFSGRTSRTQMAREWLKLPKHTKRVAVLKAVEDRLEALGHELLKRYTERT